MSSSGQIGSQQIQAGGVTAIWGNWESPVITPQTLFYSGTAAAGTMSLVILINKYTF
jgi:hypothetical protein